MIFDNIENAKLYEKLNEKFEKLNALIVDGYTAGRPIYLQMPEK